MTISFTPGMRTHTVVMKLRDYVQVENPIISRFSEPMGDGYETDSDNEGGRGEDGSYMINHSKAQPKQYQRLTLLATSAALDEKIDLVAEVGLDSDGREFIVSEGPMYPQIKGTGFTDADMDQDYEKNHIDREAEIRRGGKGPQQKKSPDDFHAWSHEKSTTSDPAKNPQNGVISTSEQDYFFHQKSKYPKTPETKKSHDSDLKRQIQSQTKNVSLLGHSYPSGKDKWLVTDEVYKGVASLENETDRQNFEKQTEIMRNRKYREKTGGRKYWNDRQHIDFIEENGIKMEGELSDDEDTAHQFCDSDKEVEWLDPAEMGKKQLSEGK